MNHQQHLQQLLLKIPLGKVTSYKALANAMGLRSYRQVGQLLHSNPDPDRYPCFKVVKSDGSLGGFALGLQEKIRRLRAEGIAVQGNRIIDFEKKVYRLQ